MTSNLMDFILNMQKIHIFYWCEDNFTNKVNKVRVSVLFPFLLRLVMKNKVYMKKISRIITNYTNGLKKKG